MIKAVVFDLDGTLANTTAIHGGRRTPWDLLSPGVAGEKAEKWAFRQYVNDLPGELIQKGYRVGVATSRLSRTPQRHYICLESTLKLWSLRRD